MNKVGITGGIGSGKSHVCKILEDMGYPIFYTDNEAKLILINNVEVRNFIVKNYGEESFIDNKPNSKHLANILFNDDLEMKRLSDLTTPIIRSKLSKWLVDNSNHEFTFVESAIIFEYGLDVLFDSVVCVSASFNTRIDRVLKRDSHRTREDVVTIMGKQFSEEKRTELSDHIIFNDNITEKEIKTRDVLIEEIEEILKKIKEKC